MKSNDELIKFLKKKGWLTHAQAEQAAEYCK